MSNVEDHFPKKEGGKLNIYFHVGENSGVGYYREYLPAIKLRESGLANTMINDFQWGEGDHTEPTLQTLFAIANWADVVVVGRRDTIDYIAQWGGIKEFFNIPIILDTDDNVHHVRPNNPGYQGYHPGSEALLWNKYSINKTFSAITVTTQDLKDFYSKINPKIYILPNNLDLIEWNSHPKKFFDDGIIRMGFIGSAAHPEGIQIIRKPVLDIMNKYPNTRLQITHIFKNLLNYPEEIMKRVDLIPWIKLQEWPRGLKNIGLDIGLAPLADNMFNRSKSNLRWMEYSLAGFATIASPVAPYKCVKHGYDGFLAKERDEWYNYIEALLDKDLRKKISDNAYKTITEEYDINKNIGKWRDVYEEVHRKYHSFFGPKKKFVRIGKKGKYKQIK